MGPHARTAGRDRPGARLTGAGGSPVATPFPVDATRPVLPNVAGPGRLSVVVTYLEMRGPPGHEPVARPRGNVAIVRAAPPTASYYRFLYNGVGENWLWHERRRLPDADLRAIVAHPAVEVWVLYWNGTPAGYFEIDRRDPRDTDLAYFGLMPEFIGLRLGPWLLDQAIRIGWQGAVRRLLVNTCTFDHPKALPLYLSMGFTPIRHVVREIDDPRVRGPLPRSAGPHIPIVE